jgi:hypothetical protein
MLGVPSMLEIVFNAANWFALPFWALMILLPGWKVTRRVMESLLPIALLAAVYLYLLAGGFSTATLREFFNPQLSLSNLTALFSQPSVMATGVGSLHRHGFVCGTMDLLGGVGKAGLDNPFPAAVLVCRASGLALPSAYGGSCPGTPAKPVGGKDSRDRSAARVG